MSKHEMSSEDISKQEINKNTQKHTDRTKRSKKKGKPALKILIVLAVIAVIIGVVYFVFNHVSLKRYERINLVINNRNMTESLKNDVIIENDVIYISSKDVGNFFDSSIFYDNKYDQIITSSYDKLAALPVGKTQIQVNSSNTTIKAPVMKKGENFYIPFSALEDIYNVKVNYQESMNIVTVDSLDRDYSIATASKNSNVKYKPSDFSKTLAKVKKGDSYIIANREDFPVPDGWTRVRTQSGVLGYVKTKSMGPVNTIREAMVEKKKVEGPVSLVWDYYSEYVSAPDRSGTTIKGVNVVSPTFFTLRRLGKGAVDENVGEQGKKYITWAKQNGYQVWPSISNNSYIDTTAEIMRDYKLREKLINQILEYVTTYQLNGINIDFENMYAEDKDNFSQFLAELRPRLNEIGAVLSVDVTAPDGGETWSMCYNRNAISKIADYIIFMGYDQYGESSTKSGTTAGCDWVELNINKFLGQEGVEADKLILGIPFYTRFWVERNGKISSREVVLMKNVDKVLPASAKKKWDENLKQYYVEYKQNGATYKMWIEDEKSIEAKLDLITKYNLAGAAFWEKDMETDSIWDLVSSKLGI